MGFWDMKIYLLGVKQWRHQNFLWGHWGGKMRFWVGKNPKNCRNGWFLPFFTSYEEKWEQSLQLGGKCPPLMPPLVSSNFCYHTGRISLLVHLSWYVGEICTSQFRNHIQKSYLEGTRKVMFEALQIPKHFIIYRIKKPIIWCCSVIFLFIFQSSKSGKTVYYPKLPQSLNNVLILSNQFTPIENYSR